MKRLTICLLLVMVSVLSMAQSASAHVFFTDESGEVGVIMHITPDDDPIAGLETLIFIDIQSEVITTKNHIFTLNVFDGKGQSASAGIYPSSTTTLNAKYTFPYQGNYELQLIATPITNRTSSKPTVFNYSQRVSRGKLASPLDQPRYPWAEFGLLASSCAIVVLILVVMSRRKQIAAFTK